MSNTTLKQRAVLAALSFALASLVVVASQAAPWERPIGAFTPTNHSANITKYQIDSAAKTAISSVKVDGDLNKAFQGLNDIEARTPPSVTGNNGKFLTIQSGGLLWADIASDTLVSGTTRVLAGAASVNLTTGALTSVFNSSGLSTAGISASAVTATSVYVSGAIVAAGLSATVVTASSVIAPVVSATNVSATNISVTNLGGQNTIISGSGVALAKAALTFNGSVGCTVTKGYNVSGCTRTAVGQYGVSFSTAMPDANYVVVCSAVGASMNAGSVASFGGDSVTTTGFRIGTTYINGGSTAYVDTSRVSCAVF